MSQREPNQDRIVLNVEDIRVDANPDAIASMMSALIHIPSYRKSFEADPVAHLRECGIGVPDGFDARITPESIRSTLDDLTEGGEERTAAAIPGVAVVVRVGTRPGTNPSVSVGARVATGTAVFARPESEEERGTGLAPRQQGQAAKRQKRAPDAEE